MDAETTSKSTETAAEKMRGAAEAAHVEARLRAEAEQQKLEEAITATVETVRGSIDSKISEAAQEGLRTTNHTYTERISASRNTREQVALVEQFADSVVESLTAGLQVDGYEVEAHSREVVDYRDVPDAPPEYYDTVVCVRW